MTDQNQVARLWVGDDNGSNGLRVPILEAFLGSAPTAPTQKVFLALSRSVSVKESIFGWLTWKTTLVVSAV